MSIGDRVSRLERVVLGMASLITGEAHAVAKEGEIEALQAQMAQDLKGMADEL